MKSEFQMDCYGHHRIKVGDIIGHPALYECPSFVMVDGEMYVAFTEYYAGYVPTECVIKLLSIESTSTDETEICNFFRPEEICTHMEIKTK